MRYIILVILMCGCSTIEPNPIVEDEFVTKSQGLQTESQLKSYVHATTELIKSLETENDEMYVIGAGDRLSLNVWNRDRVSLTDVVVGPDGRFQIPRIGFIDTKGKNCEILNKEIRNALSILYENPEVSLSVLEYNNNRAYVLGRVSYPGLVKFQGKGRLLEALSLAGGLPVIAKKAFLTRCAIIRGQDKILWIDLRELLRGNMGLNARIYNGDIIYIPESGDEMAYVMGEIKQPGAIVLKETLTFLDAIMMSGGPTNSSGTYKGYLVRQVNEGKKVIEIDYNAMISKGDHSQNFLLQDNDIVFLAPSTLTKFNAFLNDTLPFLRVLSLGSGVANSLGVTNTSN